MPCMSHIRAPAQVEIDAKVYAGYYAGDKQVKSWEELNQTVGRKAADAPYRRGLGQLCKRSR